MYDKRRDELLDAIEQLKGKRFFEDLQDIKKELSKIENLKKAVQKRLDDQRRKGDSRGAELSEKAYSYCTDYAKRLKHIVDGYRRKMDGQHYFTKDGLDRYHDSKPDPKKKGN